MAFSQTLRLGMADTVAIGRKWGIAGGRRLRRGSLLGGGAGAGGFDGVAGVAVRAAGGRDGGEGVAGGASVEAAAVSPASGARTLGSSLARGGGSAATDAVSPVEGRAVIITPLAGATTAMPPWESFSAAPTPAPASTTVAATGRTHDRALGDVATLALSTAPVVDTPRAGSPPSLAFQPCEPALPGVFAVGSGAFVASHVGSRAR